MNTTTNTNDNNERKNTKSVILTPFMANKTCHDI